MLLVTLYKFDILLPIKLIMTINQLKLLRETEDKVELNAAERNYPYNGGSHKDPADRRKCFRGYIVALANEGGFWYWGCQTNSLTRWWVLILVRERSKN